MAILPSGDVGCDKRWEVVNLLGDISAGGIERRKVVEVPRERIASPGAENATTVAELSPVNGATIQSGTMTAFNVDLYRVKVYGIPGLNPHRSTHQ
jgi:hypothetical protein